jgi:GNAT superfamily N-acetyltransferase
MRGPLVVVGDALLDVDLVGRAGRLMPDAPAPVLVELEERPRPGGAGLAAALLDAAVALARAGGARAVEGYPVDRAERPGATAAELWHGTVGLFTRAGFTETARPAPARPVMTLRFD